MKNEENNKIKIKKKENTMSKLNLTKEQFKQKCECLDHDGNLKGHYLTDGALDEIAIETNTENWDDNHTLWTIEIIQDEYNCLLRYAENGEYEVTFYCEEKSEESDEVEIVENANYIVFLDNDDNEKHAMRLSAIKSYSDLMLDAEYALVKQNDRKKHDEKAKQALQAAQDYLKTIDCDFIEYRYIENCDKVDVVVK
jgi:hypothetical protein